MREAPGRGAGRGRAARELRGRAETLAIVVAVVASGLTSAALAPSPLSARQDTAGVVPGVELGMAYEGRTVRSLVVRGFRTGAPAGGGDEVGGAAWADGVALAGAAGAIVARDLELSDRFSVLEAPPSLARGPPDFPAWDGLGVDYVVDGEVAAVEGGSVLRLEVYDVLYARVLERGVFPVPPLGSHGFRMAMHALSDLVVRWITGEPGMAASRVAFLRRREDGGSDLMVVDSDGEGLRRVAHIETLAFSPVWSPDGGRIVHTAMSADGAGYRVVERDLAGGAIRDRTPGPGLPLTPAYTPDGERLALALSTGRQEDIHEVDLGTGAARRVQARALAPAYSADGRFLAFGSGRLGPHHVWVRPRAGGDPVLVSPFEGDTRTHFELPDWSPVAPVLAFHGGRALDFQVLVVDLEDAERRVRQITGEGWSESPSWAPDGRHLVVHGSREGRTGLYVLDARTGRTRLLVGGADVRTPDWSPALAVGGSGAS